MQQGGFEMPPTALAISLQKDIVKDHFTTVYHCRQVQSIWGWFLLWKYHLFGLIKDPMRQSDTQIITSQKKKILGSLLAGMVKNSKIHPEKLKLTQKKVSEVRFYNWIFWGCKKKPKKTTLQFLVIEAEKFLS